MWKLFLPLLVLNYSCRSTKTAGQHLTKLMTDIDNFEDLSASSGEHWTPFPLKLSFQLYLHILHVFVFTENAKTTLHFPSTDQGCDKILFTLVPLYFYWSFYLLLMQTGGTRTTSFQFVLDVNKMIAVIHSHQNEIQLINALKCSIQFINGLQLSVILLRKCY